MSKNNARVHSKSHKHTDRQAHTRTHAHAKPHNLCLSVRGRTRVRPHDTASAHSNVAHALLRAYLLDSVRRTARSTREIVGRRENVCLVQCSALPRPFPPSPPPAATRQHIHNVRCAQRVAHQRKRDGVMRRRLCTTWRAVNLPPAARSPVVVLLPPPLMLLLLCQ